MGRDQPLPANSAPHRGRGRLSFQFGRGRGTFNIFSPRPKALDERLCQVE